MASQLNPGADVSLMASWRLNGIGVLRIVSMLALKGADRVGF